MESRRFDNRGLYAVYSSPDLLENKSRRLRLAGHVACVGRGEVYTGFWQRNVREKDHLEDPRVYRRITVKWIFERFDGA